MGQRVVFEDVPDADAAELYRLRAEQVGRRISPSRANGDVADYSFTEAVEWAKRSPLTRQFLLWLAERPDELAQVSEFVEEQAVNPSQLRGAVGGFWRAAKKLGFDSQRSPVIAWEGDQAGHVGYRVTTAQARIIKQVLAAVS